LRLLQRHPGIVTGVSKIRRKVVDKRENDQTAQGLIYKFYGRDEFIKLRMEQARTLTDSQTFKGIIRDVRDFELDIFCSVLRDDDERLERALAQNVALKKGQVGMPNLGLEMKSS